MPDVDSPATGRRDTDEIEITDAMMAAGVGALMRHDPRFESEDGAVRRIYFDMVAAAPASSPLLPAT